jgi:PPOX class probable F420-dependent enzyme
MSVRLPDDVRALLAAPNYVHLSTLRADGSPRNWVVWVGLEDHLILICTSDAVSKAKDMRRDPRVGLSVSDLSNPYRMATIQGRVIEMRRDEGCRYMDPISIKYTGAPIPSRDPDRVCFVIEAEKARAHTLRFVHNPDDARPGSSGPPAHGAWFRTGEQPRRRRLGSGLSVRTGRSAHQLD